MGHILHTQHRTAREPSHGARVRWRRAAHRRASAKEVSHALGVNLSRWNPAERQAFENWSLVLALVPNSAPLDPTRKAGRSQDHPRANCSQRNALPAPDPATSAAAKGTPAVGIETITWWGRSRRDWGDASTALRTGASTSPSASLGVFEQSRTGASARFAKAGFPLWDGCLLFSNRGVPPSPLVYWNHRFREKS